MKNEKPESVRILSIVPFYQGFAYAVLNDSDLANWGRRMVPVDDDAKALDKVEAIMVHYAPDVLSLEDFSRSRRGPRIRTFIRDIVDLAPKHNIGVKLFSRPEVYKAFFADGEGTKEALAALLAERFQADLGHLLPPKRRLWESEDPRLTIFDAVALALVTEKS